MGSSINNLGNPIKRTNQKVFSLKAEKLVRESSDNFIYYKNYKKALEQVNAALSIDPNHTKGYLLKGDILLCLDNEIEAIESYNNAILSNPECAQAYGSKAGVLDMIGRQEEALECCKKAFEYMNHNDKQLLLSLYDQKISILSTLKLYSRANEILSQAINNLPEEDGNYLASCYSQIQSVSKSQMSLRLVY